MPQITQLKFPEDWMSPVLQFFDGVNLALHIMQPGSQKWLEIQNNLNQTMPQAKIQQI